MDMYAFGLKDILLLKSLSNDDVKSYKQLENNLIVLYNKYNKIIGFNILNFNKDNYKGLILYPTSKLSDDVNKVLTSNHLEPITLLSSKFVVGKVIDCQNHPDSDHLHVCKVDIKSEILQIVCGAKNVQVGQKVVVAPINTMMFDGTIILEGILRNVKSYGMICSGYELNLPSFQKGQGILVLDDTYQVGQPYFER